MAEYVTLLGAEDVAHAARNMQGAADGMQRASNQFYETTERLIRALEEHNMRMERALEKLHPKCDGDHGGPCCVDPECWQRESLRTRLESIKKDA